MRHNVEDELDMAMYSQEVFRRKYKFMPFFRMLKILGVATLIF